MLFTLLGIVTEVKPEQPLKAYQPMLVTAQDPPLYFTDFGITTFPVYSPLLFATTVAVTSMS